MLAVPDLENLTDEQHQVLALPMDSSHLIVGGPGSGKTVLAAYRAAMFHRAGRSAVLLTYGKVLSRYAAEATSRLEAQGVTSTYHTWFDKYWRSQYRAGPPRHERSIDWMQCLERFLNDPPRSNENVNIVIDEGQDLPQGLYLILAQIADTLTVFADPNQRITDDQSTVQEIRSSMRVPVVHRINGRHRSPHPITALADHFRLEVDSSEQAAVDSLEGEHPTLLHHPSVAALVDMLAAYERDHAEQTIGVLLPRAAQVAQLVDKLEGRTRNPVQAYLSKGSIRRPLPTIEFHQPGIKILTWVSSKGLEFDSVVLPELQSVIGDPYANDLRMKLHVLCSRARQSLILAYSGSGEPALVSAIPPGLIVDGRGS